MVPRKLLAAIAVGMVAAFQVATGVASAQTKVEVLYNPSADMTGMFIAEDQGFFAKQGLDIDPILSSNAGAVAGALMSGTVQLGTSSPPVFLQADEQGLDLVVIAGTDLTVAPPKQVAGFAIRENSGIDSLSDLIGKKVGVAVLGSSLDVLAHRRLQSDGIDYRRVTWVEIPFLQMGDALKSGLVDAVVTPYPFYARIIDSKVGYAMGGELAPAGVMPVLYLSTRDWATQHANVVAAFRAALDDAAAFFRDPSHQEAVFASVAKWTKLPPQAVTASSLPANLTVHVEPKYLAFWIDTLHGQGLIKGNLDPASLIVP